MINRRPSALRKDDMTATRKPKMQEQWQVEWCSILPELEDCPGCADWDMATYETREFPTKAEAIAFARELLAPGNLPVNVATLSRQELEVNADILEHEGRTIREWVDKERCELSDVDDCMIDVKLDAIRY